MQNKTINTMVSPHTSQNRFHQSLQIINAGKGIEKENPPTLLVEIWIITATMENNMEIL